MPLMTREKFRSRPYLASHPMPATGSVLLQLRTTEPVTTPLRPIPGLSDAGKRRARMAPSRYLDSARHARQLPGKRPPKNPPSDISPANSDDPGQGKAAIEL